MPSLVLAGAEGGKGPSEQHLPGPQTILLGEEPSQYSNKRGIRLTPADFLPFLPLFFL